MSEHKRSRIISFLLSLKCCICGNVKTIVCLSDDLAKCSKMTIVMFKFNLELFPTTARQYFESLGWILL